MYLIFDTETTGLPKNYNAPLTDADNWPRLVQLAWQLHAADGSLLESDNRIIIPDGFDIPYNSEKVHGISTEKALKEGEPLDSVLKLFTSMLAKCQLVAGHNIEFDINIMGAEYLRIEGAEHISGMPNVDTKNESTAFCAIPGGRGGKFKWPRLTELHIKLFDEGFEEAHNAAADVAATARCFLELIRIGVIDHRTAKLTEEQYAAFLARNKEPFRTEDVGVKKQVGERSDRPNDEVQTPATDVGKIAHDFAHLHCHSQFSVLQATIRIQNLVNRALEMGMPAVGLTDHGNMFGVFYFVDAIEKANEKIENHNKQIDSGAVEGERKKPIKGVVGSEFYLTEDLNDRTRQSNGYQTVLLAKNKKGYHNLAKLSSISYMLGFYYVPRIDRSTLLKYSSDLIATTGGLGGEIPSLILNVGEKQAEEAFVWWKENFGDDFYIELLNHGLEEEKILNSVLLKFASKYGVKYFPGNNVYYLDEKDSRAHDILMCVKENVKVDEPSRGRDFIKRRFPNSQFYFKSQEEMKLLFGHLPESFATIGEILSKVEPFTLRQKVMLPSFSIPDAFRVEEDLKDGGTRGENSYLKHLAYEGAAKRYGTITPEIRERLDFELDTIEFTGYPGYFLIVQDFTLQARKMGVWVGPGRGSAAGSAVAYCIGITNIDPLKYDLLFERFLNPSRISLPDIDMDFDDEGRGKIIDWVIEKYGRNQVAQIVTYGSMGAKSALRDTARVLNLPLSDADRIAKLVPGVSLSRIFDSEDNELEEELKGDSERLAQLAEFRELAAGDDEIARTIQQARRLEGSVRNTGVHACGVIIAPDDITNHVPVATAKDSDLAITQYDNKVVESAGLLKMDFLGLKTLSILRDALILIDERHHVKIDLDTLPLDDQKTYELFKLGLTNATFQFESGGMRKNLRELRPTVFADLIAMVALYRPGPMRYIPDFIKRKNGLEPIVYDLPEMEEHLSETYGICVYQEQVMLLSQKLAGFSKSDADKLRKAMGKKDQVLLSEKKLAFIEGCAAHGHDETIVKKIWSDWESFARYAFNKSHATCYAILAYQTAYLKANYPPEYMASVLTHNMNDIKKVTFFMDECRSLSIPVLSPDVNESQFRFAVNDKQEIRFGLGAIKGVGEGAVEAVINERKLNGPYRSICDFTKRVDLRSVNRRCMESLALSGAFDSFDSLHRAQYFDDDGSGAFIDKAVRFGARAQESAKSSQGDLFGGTAELPLQEPVPPQCEHWSNIRKLKAEKEVVGVYISGHPLNDFELTMDRHCNTNLEIVQSEDAKKSSGEFKMAVIVSSVQHKMSLKGNPYGIFTVEDKRDSMELKLFGKDYTAYRQYLDVDYFLYLRGRWTEPYRPKDDGQTPKPKPEKRFKISGIQLLNDILEKKTDSMIIDVRLSDIKEQNISELQAFLSKYPGKCKLKIRVLGNEDEHIILYSNKLRVSADQDLVFGLRNKLGLEVMLK